jgi:chromosome segregation ATPase
MKKELSQSVVLLEDSLKKLLDDYSSLRAKNAELSQTIDKLNKELQYLRGQNSELKEKYTRSKIASALNGTGDGGRETKLRINRLVREIDDCIAILQG